MYKRTRLCFCIAVFFNLLSTSAEDIELPQGGKIAIGLLEKLHTAHEVAINQKAQEDLFLSLPLSAPDQLNSVTVANTTAVTSPNKVRLRKVRTAASSSPLERRATQCDGELWQEGQDPCEGRENEPGYVACYPACQFTRDVSMSTTTLNIIELICRT
jgi:hypothetical protein